MGPSQKTTTRDNLLPLKQRYIPADCPHCEYDRQFPGFEGGGWVQQDNNGPIVSCPLCNPNGIHPRT